MRRLILAAVMLQMACRPTFAGHGPDAEQHRRVVEVGRGMELIAPGLMQIGLETNFFLLLADQARISKEQRKALEEISFAAQKHIVQRLADLNVADAELQRLLTRDQINLDAVQAKIEEMTTIESDVKMRKVEFVLRAINALTHEQHLKIVTLVRDVSEMESAPASQRLER